MDVDIAPGTIGVADVRGMDGRAAAGIGARRDVAESSLTRGLKLQTEVGSGTGGNQVGLSYQFEY